jgi:GTP-binding protein
VQPVVSQGAEAVRVARVTRAEPAAYAVHRPAAESFRVERDDAGFVVIGREAERAVAVSDLTNLDALQFVHDRLKRMGVDRALSRAGAKVGDTVRIGGMVFEYED